MAQSWVGWFTSVCSCGFYHLALKLPECVHQTRKRIRDVVTRISSHVGGVELLMIRCGWLLRRRPQRIILWHRLLDEKRLAAHLLIIIVHPFGIPGLCRTVLWVGTWILKGCGDVCINIVHASALHRTPRFNLLIT